MHTSKLVIHTSIALVMENYCNKIPVESNMPYDVLTNNRYPVCLPLREQQLPGCSKEIPDSLFINNNTYVTLDGKFRSFCGLMIQDVIQTHDKVGICTRTTSNQLYMKPGERSQTNCAPKISQCEEVLGNIPVSGSIGIHSENIVRKDGTIQTYHGLKLTGMNMACSFKESMPGPSSTKPGVMHSSTLYEPCARAPDKPFIDYHSYTFIRADGKIQTFCGPKINENKQPSNNLVNGLITIHSDDINRPDRRIQRYHGLKLTGNSRSIGIHSEDIVRRDGKIQRYHGLKLTGNGVSSSGPCLVVSDNSQPINHLPIQHPKTFQSKRKSSKTSVNYALQAQKQVVQQQYTSSVRKKKGQVTENYERAAFISTGVNPSFFDLGPPSYTCGTCNAVMWFEERNTNLSTLANPTFSSCCQNGKILLETLIDAPPPLNKLLDYDQPGTSHFREHIRAYNSMFSFTSFGAKIDHSVNEGRGLYTFRVSGQNYHRIGSLLPASGDEPKYAQLYFHDTQNEASNRIAAIFGKNTNNRKIDEQVVHGLIKMLNEHSSVTKAFRMARDWCSANNNANCELRLLHQRTNLRQYNRPTVSEIAVLVTNDFGDSDEPRDIVVKTANGALKRISELHQLYMPLQYPLLFPYGETGFHEKIPYYSNIGRRKTKRNCVTMREYYCYRIHYRRNEATTLLRSGRLFQQYLVDAYTAIEEQRLRWYRSHQDELRVDLYHNVCDAVTKGDTKADAIGQRIVLPATFTGSPRYMVQNYQDAMALCRKFGNPDLFITFTANPKWPEIDHMVSLISGQKSHDRPETVARTFKLKLNELMDDIMKKHIFGKCTAGVYTIEFQKRGLPHAHILIWLDAQSKCKTPAEIDDLIVAEIPSKTDDPEGYRAVTDYMLHGPCGPDATDAVCTIKGKCTKHFPKPFYEETTIDGDGYPVYRRRNNNVHVVKSKARLDNRFVVPYNRFLLLKYEAHINIEWCNRSRAIKYLFKYLNKGPDRATIVIHENVTQDGQTKAEKITKVDEIQNYLDCRYLSPCEAVWRMFALDIHYSKPSVMKLIFHLPNQNTITLHDSQSLPALLRRDGIKETMFTQWFELNKREEHARGLKYAEIPSAYVWNDTNKIWTPRSGPPSVGRIVYCNPAAGPRYYLRMLLNVVKGPKSFKEIRTVNGTVYKTFKEACYAYGLLNDDKEWSEALVEAKAWATGPQLRQLFVTMLLFCEVSSPLNLWQQNWEDLADDILYKKRKHFAFPNLQLTDEQKQNYCLLELQELLQRNGKSLDDFPDLPKPDPTLLSNIDNRLIREELAYNKQEEAIQHQILYTSLNSDQHRIYERVIESVKQQKDGFYFVYGPGGTGKTFLYKAIISRLRSEGLIVLAVASSGIASLLLPGGRTAHSRFVIPLELLESSTCGIKQNTHLSELIHQVKLIIWDEAPMCQKYAFEALDKTLKDILGLKEPRNRKRIFGGMTVLLGGDFRQILPVIPKGKRQEVVQACINRSNLWKQCHLFTLSRSMRVNEITSTGEIDAEKQQFNKWVLDVGDGVVPAKSKEGEDEATWIEIPEKHIIKYDSSPIESIIKETFPDFIDRHNDEEYLRERAILTPKNDDADQINEVMFNKLNHPGKTYKSSDEICKASTDSLEQEDLYPVEFLNSLTFPGMPPHELNVKEGLPVMLLRNVSPTQGLCNGTRLIVTALGKFVIKARILTGAKAGDTALIPRITLSSTKSKWPFILKRRQFPIKPCYAMTVNKSQGQSLNFVGLYLPNPVFSHGQLYVALSRVTTPDGFKVLIIQDNDEQLKNHTKNIVFKEVFNNLKTTIV